MKQSFFERTNALLSRLRDSFPEGAAMLSEPLDLVMQHIVPDTAGIYEQVAAARARHPGGSDEDVYEELVRDATQTVLKMSAGIAAPSIIPGIGTLISALGVPAEVAMLWAVQARLVLSIAALYGYDLSTKEQRWRVLTTAGLAAVPTVVARRLIRRGVARLGVRFLGIVGAAADVSLNVASTAAVARRAHAYYRRHEIIETEYHVLEE